MTPEHLGVEFCKLGTSAKGHVSSLFQNLMAKTRQICTGITVSESESLVQVAWGSE